MEGLLTGGLAAPDRPRGPERLPGPAPREDIEGGAEAAEGEGDIFRSSHYLPITKEGPRDVLDGRSGISDGQPHPGLNEALPRATSATHRISSCYWDGDSLDFQPGSPPLHLLGPFPASLDVQGPWEYPMVQEAREGTPSEQRFKDSVVRTMKPYAKLKGSRKFLHHQDELKFLEKYSPSHHKFDWLQDTDEQGPLKDSGLHLDLPAQPPTVTSFRRVIVPVDDTPKTLDMEVMGTREDLEDFGEVAQPSEWGLHTSASEVATQTWTVNSEASVERLQPLLSPVQTGPYLCELLQDVGGGADSHEEEEEEPAVFPCIECSIYFKHKEHLLEHMSQHRRAPGQEPPADLAPLACSECGWAFTEPTALEQHWQLHQASREKIIEEIQKLKQLPGDEGRKARLQCPKCVFGTNSSRAFLQHAKLHVRGSPPSRQTKGPSGGGSPVLDVSTVVYASYGDSSGPDTCIHCGVTAPSKSLLREHMRLAHAHAHWEEGGEAHAHWEEGGEAFEDPTGQPGTSQDAYTHLPDTAAMDYFSRSEPLLASVWQESPSAYDPGLAFGPDYQQPGMRDCPFINSSQQSLGKLAFPSPVASASYSVQLNRNKSTVHLQRAEDKRHPWSEEEEEDNEDVVLTSEMDFAPENGAFPPLAIPSLIPQPALELKQTFQDVLQAADASETQQQQLQGMVPIVLMAKLRPQVIAAATLASPKLPPEELELRSTHPLDFLLLDTPLGGSLGLDTLLEGDPAMALKNEERKCPYCPDRFHNGIGLANHVRGHLNRVGVSYNVRHFISAEEVKAIERRFSFQKKKKKVANFDPGTFSLMRCDFCGAGFDTRAGLSSHARAHLRDFGITNWELTISPINILQELLATSAAELPPSPLGREPSGPPGSFLTSRRPRLPLTMPFPPTWAEDPGPIYGDGLCSEENTMVAMDLGSPLLPKKSLPVSGTLEQVASRLSSKVAAEVPHGSKQELPDLKAQSLTTCEVCGACFETRKGLSSHARSHLRQLGVAESESSGAPIDLLYELVKQKGLPDAPLGLPPSLAKKSSSPKEFVAGAARPGLLTLAKPMDVPAVNKAIKSPPGFSAKGLPHPSSSPLLKKAPLTLAGSPTPKNPEDKSPQLSLSPRPTSPKAQWPQSEDEGPLNLTLDSDGGRELDCQLCGAWFETRKGLSSHARAHLRHLGVSDPDAKGSPIDVLHGLIRRDGIQIRLPPGRGALAQLGRLPPASTALSLLPPPPPAKKAKLKASGVARPWGKQDLSAAGIFWASDVEPSPLNLSSGPEPTRDIRCEFCGEFFENRKGLSSHARSHLRQMGVTEWYVNGSPIDTLREILKRRTQSRPGGHLHPPGPSPKALAKVVGSAGPGSSLEARSPSDLHISPLAKKLPPPPGSPLGHSPTTSPPPTARKMFSGLATPSLPKKLKPEHMRVEIKREMLPGALHGEPHPSEGPWGTPREEMAPLNLSSRAEPVRDIRCEFCGEFFENRKGLSSHARSHLRQMGVTEWSVNGSPIDTLREILKKKSKLCLIKKEPPAGDLAPALNEDGSPTAAPGAMHSPLPLSPLASRPGKPGAGPTQVPRELSLSPITGSKPSATSYLGPMATKRPLQEDRFLPAEVKAKTYIQTELPFKAKTLHEKTSHSSTEACCELCGLYFENRKALASHARAHLRQFGVTEWCVNGSPIETLSEWIKHRPQKVGAYRSYIQGGRPFTKKFRSAGHGRDSDKRPPLGLAPGGLSLVGRSAGGEPGPEASRAADSGERPLATSPPGTVKSEEHQRQNINKFERRQARTSDASAARGGEEANGLQQKLEEVRQPPPRVRPVPSLVPRPPQTSLVKFVGNIYTLKCRFCEVEFQGPLSIQEEWVRHLQRHILEMNFSKADPPPEEPQAPQAQTAAVEAP